MKFAHPWHHWFFTRKEKIHDEHGRVARSEWHCSVCMKTWSKQHKYQKWITEVIA